MTGNAGLSVNVVAGQSAVTEAWCSNPLKLLTPRSRGPSVWAYLSSFGGGLVAGDRTSLTVRVGPNARCFITTQSSTKVYRNPQRKQCSHKLSARLEENSLLIMAPEPVQSFADSNYRQLQDFHLHPTAGLVLMDWFSSGRAARGERWTFHRLQSRNEVFIDGRRCLLDSLELDHAHGPIGGVHRLGRFNCVAMVSIVGAPLREKAGALLASVGSQSIGKRASLVFSASPVGGGVVLRIAGEHQEEVARYIYQALEFVGQLLRDDPWIRKLHNN
jgi:urease accessory protein